MTELLTELGAMLAEEGERAELFRVGGAAMALAYNTRRFTRDIDALFEPKSVVYEAARKVAERHDLAPHWLISTRRVRSLRRSSIWCASS
jgi:hypothetical protein